MIYGSRFFIRSKKYRPGYETLETDAYPTLYALIFSAIIVGIAFVYGGFAAWVGRAFAVWSAFALIWCAAYVRREK